MIYQKKLAGIAFSIKNFPFVCIFAGFLIMYKIPMANFMLMKLDNCDKPLLQKGDIKKMLITSSG